MIHGTETIELSKVGYPTPNEWQIQQIQMPDGSMYVKLLVLSAGGLTAACFTGEEAQKLASAMRNAGRNALAGVWQHGRPTSAQRGAAAVAAPEPSAPSTADSGRQ